MTPRTLAPPPTNNRMWRKTLALVHPDRGGDHEAFVWLSSLREHFEECPTGHPSKAARSTIAERVPYDEALGYPDEFVNLTLRALSVGRHAEEPYRSVLGLLLDCPVVGHGRRAEKQCQGASYKALAKVGHLCGWSKAEGVCFYDLARSIPLSQAHVGHILGKLSREAAA